MNRVARRATVIALLGLTGAWGCGETSGEVPQQVARGEFLLSCTDSIEDVYVLPKELPPHAPTERGAIVRCARDRVLSVADLSAVLARAAYQGAPLQSGATIYRIAYRTERVTRPDGTIESGISAALLIVPDSPLSVPFPMVVAAHGSVGLAASCAPSLKNLDDSSALGSAQLMALAPAGHGFLVIAPDYAGYGYGSIHAWQSSEDEAHSVLDATRAAASAFSPGSFTGEVFMIGHSQGGHAVLSANALAGKYGLAGAIAGTYAFAPAWFASRMYGAALSPWSKYNTKDNSGDLVYSLTYFFGHGEVYDGPGGGEAIFLPSKRAQARQAFADKCLGDAERAMRGLGYAPSEFLEPAFVEQVATDCAVFSRCTKPLPAKWRARFRADRPTIDTRGGPIVIWQGRRDATVRVDMAACGFARIRQDLKDDSSATTSFTVCGSADASHARIVPLGMDWVVRSMISRVLGVEGPSACPDEALLNPPDGVLDCNPLPPDID
ncbi:MAG: alpha/beta fold hydrolase [Deltaproteobacteria bacterium]|nr:alpha/beta fold hydrolase [Deltaproteobacteria bacterium]